MAMGACDGLAMVITRLLLGFQEEKKNTNKSS
jgi:hypothetical protein